MPALFDRQTQELSGHHSSEGLGLKATLRAFGAVGLLRGANLRVEVISDRVLDGHDELEEGEQTEGNLEALRFRCSSWLLGRNLLVSLLMNGRRIGGLAA